MTFTNNPSDDVRRLGGEVLYCPLDNTPTTLHRGARLIGGEVTVLQFNSGEFDNPSAGKVLDVSLQGNHGTIGNQSFESFGKFGGGIQMDGVDDYLDITRDASNPLEGSHTIAFWIKVNYDPNVSGQNNWRALFSKTTGNGVAPIRMVMEQDRAINYSLVKGGVQYRSINGAFTGEQCPVGVWVHRAYTYNQSTGIVTAYDNGVVSRSGTMNNGGSVMSAGALDSNTDDWRVSWPSVAAPNGNGAVPASFDDFRLYNRALSQAEVQSIMDYPNSNETHDFSGQNNHLVKNGTPSMGVTGQHGECFSGTSTSNVLTVPNSSSMQVTGDMTLCMWLRPTDIAASRQNPWNKAYGGEGTITQELDGTLSFFWGQAGSNAQPYLNCTSNFSLVNNTWYHVAIIRDVAANQVRWVINGSTTNTLTPAAGKMIAVASSADVTIGSGYTSYYRGQIDDVRLYNRALSNEEVQSVMDYPYSDPPEYVLSTQSTLDETEYTLSAFDNYIPPESASVTDIVIDVLRIFVRTWTETVDADLLQLNDFVHDKFLEAFSSLDTDTYKPILPKTETSNVNISLEQFEVTARKSEAFDIDDVLTKLFPQLNKSESVLVTAVILDALSDYFLGPCTLDDVALGGSGFDKCFDAEHVNVNPVFNSVLIFIRELEMLLNVEDTKVMTPIFDVFESVNVLDELIDQISEYYWGMCSLDFLQFDSAGFDRCAVEAFSILDELVTQWIAKLGFDEAVFTDVQLFRKQFIVFSEELTYVDTWVPGLLIRALLFDEDIREYFGLEFCDSAVEELRRYTTINFEEPLDDREYPSVGFE